MELIFTAETEAELKELAAQSGSVTADELVRDVVEGYLSMSWRKRAKCLPTAMTT
jgi:hypothetical protein